MEYISAIYDEDDDGIECPVDQESWEKQKIRVLNAEAKGYIMLILTDKYIDDYTLDDLTTLEAKKNKLDLQSLVTRKQSNDLSMTIFGIDNINLYHRVTNYVLSKYDKASIPTQNQFDTYVDNINREIDSNDSKIINRRIKDIEDNIDNRSFTEQVILKDVLRKLKSI